jgi:hypothetical protein
MGSHGELSDTVNEILSKCKELCMRRSASVASSIWTTYEDDDQNVWRTLRRELCNDGIRSDDISKYSPMLKAYIKELRHKESLEYGDRASDLRFVHCNMVQPTANAIYRLIRSIVRT